MHRDLKPQNIMLVDEGRPEERFVILDFGIASQLDASQSLRGATMDGAGTPEYMSPEQLRGDEPTQESDIYSFAVILYQQLTGRVPFPMQTPSLPAFFELITNNDAPRFRDAVGDGQLSSLAEETEGVILRCLSKDPHGRVTSVREIMDAFDEALGKPGQEHQDLVRLTENLRNPFVKVSIRTDPPRKRSRSRTSIKNPPAQQSIAMMILRWMRRP